MAKTAMGSYTEGRIFVLILLVCTDGVAAIAAAEPGNASTMRAPGPDFNITNHSVTGLEMTGTSAVTPTPITVFRAELTADTLPGPRYMGFGPSVIGLSIDPRLLAVCFAVILVGLVIRFVSLRKRNGDEPDNGKNE